MVVAAGEMVEEAKAVAGTEVEGREEEGKEEQKVVGRCRKGQWRWKRQAH